MEVRDAIKQFKEWENSGWSKSETPYAMALTIAIKAMEKLVPQKPIPNKRIPGIGRCPVCKTELCIDDEDLGYCPTCGQALKGAAGSD